MLEQTLVEQLKSRLDSKTLEVQLLVRANKKMRVRLNKMQLYLWSLQIILAFVAVAAIIFFALFYR